MKIQGVYEITEAFAYELEIHYDYYWDDGDYESPPEDELEVTKVFLNGEDITTFYYDFLETQISTQLYEYYEMLGEGSFSKVFRAKFLPTSEIIAVKVSILIFLCFFRIVETNSIDIQDVQCIGAGS